MDKRFVGTEELLVDSFRLAGRIHASGFEPTFIVGLWRGGTAVGIAVQEGLAYLGRATQHISVRTSYAGRESYDPSRRDPERIQVHGTHFLLENLSAEDRLLVVDDVFSSGSSIDALVSRLRSRLKRNCPEEIRVAVPWFRPNDRSERRPDYFLHETSDWLVMPYELSGLALDEIREHKPGVAAVLDRLADFVASGEARRD